jgi:ribonucleoside-diphosphate reductase alpha chain
MDIGSRILSDMVHYGKYAKYIYNLHRRESYLETLERNKGMHISRFPQQKALIEDAYSLVAEKKILPSMRSMQFGGSAMFKNHARGYNCCYLPIEHHTSFAEAMFLLLCGTGVGYSVQRHNIMNIPPIMSPGPSQRYLIGDSIEGWADAVRHLMKAYLQGAPLPKFAYDDIRPAGSELSSGGKAPGPEPLRRVLDLTRDLLESKPIGSRLTSLDCHDILCLLSEAVLSGGIRRSAMIALFDYDDALMLNCKNPENFEYPRADGSGGKNVQRMRANNSAVLLRSLHKEYFDNIWKTVSEAGSGEPGIFWTNDLDYGTNPCCEIALRPYSFCNLTEINTSNLEDQSDYDQRAWAASIIGTLQASYTDFHYLRPIWRQTSEEDALLGIGMTGIASGCVLDLDMTQAARVACETNEWFSKSIGINQAKRVTCVKPSGTTSLVLGCSSGVHAWHDYYYIRRVRLGTDEPLAQYLMVHHPEILENSIEKPEREVIVSVPVEAPAKAITRHHESPNTILERVKKIHKEWITPGHREGANQHNVSCTVSIKSGEWREVGDWMWENRAHYTGLSCFPFWGSDSLHVQAPFETITVDDYRQRVAVLKDIDLTSIVESTNAIEHEAESACAGGACMVTRM